MDTSDTIPAILSNSGVYQKARQEAIDESLKVKDYPGNTIESLCVLSNKHSFIKMFSTDPFIVMYWTTEQIKLWKQASDLVDVDISIDASGSFVKRVNIIDENFSSDIFLYVIVLRFASKIFPVGQMISASHNTNTISDFLLKLKEDGAPTPNVIVVDCSLALLNAISLAYNDCYYNLYLQNCFKVLVGENCTLPFCLIKRDRNHLIKNVTNWKCFKEKDIRIKDFYTRCIAYSLEVEYFPLLEKVLTSILIICQSETCDENTECYKRKQWLLRKIETFAYDVTNNEIDEINEYHSIQIIKMEESEEMSETILNYLHKLNSYCQLKCSDNIRVDFPKPNLLECPGLVDNLIVLFSQFPAWTNIMNKYYSTKKCSTSTGSELYFRILKNEYNMSHPISANRFILSHLKLIDGEMKLGKAIVKNMKNTSENSVKKTYNKESTKGFLRCTIINGSILPSVWLKNRQYQLINTCPIDSILEVIISGYEINKFKVTVNNHLNNNQNDFLKLVKTYTEKFDLPLLYTERAKIMLSLVECKQNIVDCEMNVITLFEKLMKSFSDTVGVINCSACGYTKTLHYQTKTINCFDFNDCDAFTNLVVSTFSQETYNCRKCQNINASLVYELGCYIAIDVENIFVEAFKNSAIVSTDNILKCVQNLPLYLYVDKKQYILVGVVEFIPVISGRGSHYITYIRKPSFWEKRNDLDQNVEYIPLSKLNVYVALIIYIQIS